MGVVMTGKKRKKASSKSGYSAKMSQVMKESWARRRGRKVTPVIKLPETLRSNSELTVADVNSIIDRCAHNGVLSFQYGDLQLLFKKTLDEPKTEVTKQRSVDSNELSNLIVASGVDPQQRLQEASDMISDELEHLKITDPAAYEEFIASEESIDDERDGS